MLKLDAYLKLNENNQTYSYGCAMVEFNFPELVKLIKQIDLNDLYLIENTESFGIEFDSHVTLLYGLHEGVTADTVLNICKLFPMGAIILNKISCFNNDKYDVLKLEAKNSSLQLINGGLMSLPNSNSYPDYKPHCTIAYLKPGMGEKYVKLFKNMEFLVFPTNLVYSEPNKNKTKVPILKNLRSNG